MKKNIITIIAAAALFSSCKKESTLAFDFDITLPKTEYKLGEIVTFQLTGNPNSIVFYSGQVGKEYKYKDRTGDMGQVSLNLRTAMTTTSTQTGTLHVMATKDDAVIDSARVVGANWTEITSRFPLATNATVVSSTANINDLIPGDKPITIALKYTSVNTAVQPAWTISAFTVANLASTGVSYPVIAPVNSTASWFFVHVLTAPNVISSPWIFASTASFSIPTAAVGTPPRTDWLVSKPIYPFRLTPDPGVSIKNATTAGLVTTYNLVDATGIKSIYTAAGTYIITFVASNDTKDGRKEVVKEFTITVTP